MSDTDDFREATARVLDREEVEGVLSGSFYRAANAPEKPAKKPNKASHYKVICISMYLDDLARLDAMVDDLKARGMTKANRSALIRFALDEVDLDKVPKGL